MRPRSLEKCVAMQQAFGVSLRRMRIDLGLTQADVAKWSGLPQQYVSEIESGRVNLTLQTLVILADMLDVELGTILVLPKRRLHVKKSVSSR